MSDKSKTIADLAFHADQPTACSFEVLRRWVIWQFPRPHEGGMLGAVHPPLAGHGWYPAIIKPKSDNVLIHAHLDHRFDSPETAVKHFKRP